MTAPTTALLPHPDAASPLCLVVCALSFLLRLVTSLHEAIFIDDDDREALLDVIARAFYGFDAQTLACCFRIGRSITLAKQAKSKT